MNLSNILKDPIDILLLLIYVVGVLIMVYSAMQFVHGTIYKDKPAIKSGIKTFFLAVILLVPRLSYQHLRIDGADYKKSVKDSLTSINSIYKDQGTSDVSGLKVQMESLSERLADDGLKVELQSSVEEGNGSTYTIRNMSAIKPATKSADPADIVLISTSLDVDSDYSYAADLSVMESLAHKLSAYDSSVEIRFLVSMDGRQGQDAAKYYLDSLDDSIVDRIICNIGYKMQSLADYTGLLGFTPNGKGNPVSSHISSSVKRMTGQSLDVKQLKTAEYISFHLNDIPAMYLEQATVADSSNADSINDLDIDQIADVAAVIGDTVIPMIKSETSDLTSSLSGDLRTTYCSGSFIKGKDTFIIGSSMREIAEAYGTSLTSLSQKDSDGNDLYSGNLYILTFDDAVGVTFHIKDNVLNKISINTGDIPVTKDELTQILSNLFGNYQNVDNTLIWTDADSGAAYIISDTDSTDALNMMTSGGYSFYISSN